MIHAIAKTWWAFVLRGVLTILFGVAAIAQPQITAAVLVTLFGFFALIEGIAAAVQSFGIRKHEEDWWLMLVGGLIAAAIGGLTLFRPDVTILAIVLYIGVWAIVSGIVQVIFAVRVRKLVEGEGWLVLGGLLSVIAGLLLLFQPAMGAATLVTVLAVYAILFGLFVVVVGFRLRSLAKRLPDDAVPAPA